MHNSMTDTCGSVSTGISNPVHLLRGSQNMKLQSKFNMPKVDVMFTTIRNDNDPRNVWSKAFCGQWEFY